IEKIPPPKGSSESLKALIFDAFYDEHRGVIVYVRIVDGIIKKGDRINFFQSNTSSIASEVGYFIPNLSERESISVGEIGYIVTGVKDIRLARVGDTIYRKGEDIDPLTGYSKPKPMVFFGMYPKESSSLGKLRDALNKISLNDTSITFTEEYSSFLGSGYRVGFLGLLHAEIIKERMENEERLDILLTMPHVLYEEDSDGHIREPYIALTIYTPKEYVGSIISLCENKKGKLSDLSYFQNNAVIKYEMPYTMLVRGIASDIKSLSSGFATIDYEHLGFKDADLVNIEILINGLSIDILSERVYRDEALYKARQKTQKLKETLPRQQFRQIIQAVVGGNILAREEISPYRKDVLAKMSGGDRTRKDKLLEAQKKGKAKLNQTGKVSLPQEVLYSLIKS
ncbi:MAG: elongation factor 4, partial [Candidatus Levybacteria bacterium]|nr:elongation factor 4 [Candidatus Levybacteria bacterium]